MIPRKCKKNSRENTAGMIVNVMKKEIPEWQPVVKTGDKSTKNFKVTFIIRD